MVPASVNADRCCRTSRRSGAGGRWRDHRQVIDAIAFKYRTGTPWMDLPERFGSRKGVHNRLRTSGRRRHLGESLQRPARPSRHRRRPRLGRRGRLHHRPCSPARRRGSSKRGARPASRTTMPSDGPAAG
ncbi:transposase [Streptomyces sp. NPDC004044]